MCVDCKSTLITRQGGSVVCAVGSPNQSVKQTQ